MTTPVNVVGANRTLILAGGIQTVARGVWDGRVKVQVDTFAMATTFDVGSTLKLFSLPAGATILGFELSVSVAQGSLTFSFGNGDTANLFAVAGNTGLQTALTPIKITGAGYVVGTGTLDTYALLTTAGAAGQSTGVLTAYCFYTVD